VSLIFLTNCFNPLRTVYTCALNDAGGVEADVTISRLASGSGEVYDPKFNGQGFYIVAGGASAFYTYSSLSAEIRRKGFNASIKDVTADLGVISIQGPNSREILQLFRSYVLRMCDKRVRSVPSLRFQMAPPGFGLVVHLGISISINGLPKRL